MIREPNIYSASAEGANAIRGIDAGAINALLQRQTGLTSQAVGYDPNDPNSALAAVARREQKRYEQDYIPVEDKAIASLDDMSIIEDAKRRVTNGNSIGRSKQRAARDAARYGFRQTAAQQANADVGLAINKAGGDADILNAARINQFDRNRGFRNQLINIGRGVADQAQSGLSDAASMQTQRNNANRQAKAQKKAQGMQLAATAAMMMMMM